MNPYVSWPVLTLKKKVVNSTEKMIITIIIRMKIYAKEGREIRRVRTICRSADHLPQPPGPFYEAEDTEEPDHAHRGQPGQICDGVDIGPNVALVFFGDNVNGDQDEGEGDDDEIEDVPPVKKVPARAET